MLVLLKMSFGVSFFGAGADACSEAGAIAVFAESGLHSVGLIPYLGPCPGATVRILLINLSLGSTGQSWTR